MRNTFGWFVMTALIATPVALQAKTLKPTLAQTETTSSGHSKKLPKGKVTAAYDGSPITPAPMYSAAGSFDVSPEFFHQADPQKLEVTPELGLSFLNIDYKKSNSVTSANQRSILLSVRGEYGILPILSVGAQLGYLSSTAEYTPPGATDGTTKGWANPNLFVKGRYGLNVGTLRFGANLSLAMDKARIGSDQSSNGYTGGHTLSPYVGYDTHVGRGTVGARFNYDMYKGERSIETLSSGGVILRSTVKGGEALSLAAFYEQPVQIYTVGGSLTYTEVAKTKTEFRSSTTQNDNGYQTYVWKVYAAGQMAPNLTLIPAISYGVATTPTMGYNDYVEHINGWGAEVAARMIF